MKSYVPSKASISLGFSMIDVLVAIIVLATGLIALAALQGALTRNGADARARSTIAAYTEGVIDQMRSLGYSVVPPGSSFPTSISPGTCTSTMSIPQAVDCRAATAQTASGVSNLKTIITASEYYGTGNGGGIGAFSTSMPTSTGSVIVAQYKQLQVTTSWTDASGLSQSLTYDTTVSPVTADPSNNTLTNTTFAFQGQNPSVREANPGNTLGVIPIAISGGDNGQNAAATNPKPVVTNTGTTFSTITYGRNESAFGGYNITQRVDTKVIQCSCAFKTDSSFAVSSDSNLTTILAQPYRPTYWDGTHYVTPDEASGKTSNTGINSGATQDADCDICCRDRNDNSTDAQNDDNYVKFDNYTNDYGTGGDLQKYEYVSNVLAPVDSGTFVQACRMIRVGGIYSTATDAHLNFFSLLGTADCASQSPNAAPTGCTSNLTASDTVPSSDTNSSYASFVQDYLYNNFTDLYTDGIPGVDSSDPLLGDYPGNMYIGASPTYPTKLSTYSLDDPANVTITLPNSVSRWLYARGIYVDHLEKDARTALKNAIENCGSTDEQDVLYCALPILPFTTINMTELANWSIGSTKTLTSGVISISDNAVIGGDASSPKRGNVTVPSGVTGTGNPTDTGVATIYVTNSGLTAVSAHQANSYYDADHVDPTSGTTVLGHEVSDKQLFTVSGNSSDCNGSTATIYFNATLSGLSWMSSTASSNLDPSMSWSGTATQLGNAGYGPVNAYLTASKSKGVTSYSVLYAGASASSPVPVCISLTPPVGLTVNVQNFNTSDSAGTESNVTCYNSDGSVNSSGNSETGATECLNYAVDTGNITITSGTGTVSNANASSALMSGTNDGGLQEGAVITIPSSPGFSSVTNTIAGSDKLNIPFTLTSTTIAPGTCSAATVCNSQGKNCQVVTKYTPGTCSN